MPRQAIRQATCTECGEDEDNHTVTNTNMEVEDDTLTYETRCQCGVEGSVVVDNAGTTAGENISHEDASWNEEQDDD